MLLVSHRIDFKAVWPRDGHADSVGVYFEKEKKSKKVMFHADADGFVDSCIFICCLFGGEESQGLSFLI